MIDEMTFLTTLYALVDDFCSTQPLAQRLGRKPSLTTSEVVTLSIFGQWARFESERGFYRYANRHLRSAFPRLPSRPQLNRLMRKNHDAIVAFFLYLAKQLHTDDTKHQILDGSGIAVRNYKRRGRGWLAGDTEIGRCTRLGWYEGFNLIIAIGTTGNITGFGFATANRNDTAVADSFLALRRHPDHRFASVGAWTSEPYIADKGYTGAKNIKYWEVAYQATVISPPQRRSKHAWSKPWRRWLASRRQIVESVYFKLLRSFRLEHERPHDLLGFRARLAAKMALHNFCIWTNQQHDRANLAFAELVDW